MPIQLSRLAATVAATVAACALAAPAGAAAPRTLTTKGEIVSIAMQDSMLAVTAARETGVCDRAMVWNSLAGGVKIVSDTSNSVTCPAERPNGGIGQVALAGSTVSWMTTFGGNIEETSWVQKALTSKPGKETTVAQATSNPETGTGNFLAGPFGRNSLTVFNSWTGDLEAPANARLRKATSAGSATVLDGPTSLLASATDGTITAVANVDGTVAVVQPSGSFTLLAPTAQVRSISINSGRVAVQEVGGLVEIYNASNGQLSDLCHLAPGSAAGIDLYKGIIAYHTYRGVRALGVATGQDRLLATAPRGVVGVQLESPGVVYGYNTFTNGHFGGKVKRVPLATVQGAVT